MGWVLLLLLVVVYFIPCWVAINRNHNSQMAIGVLNILLGWTVLGWIIALVWSCTSNVKVTAAVQKTRRCPHCAETIHPEATRCKHCQADLGGAPLQCSCGRELKTTDRICPRCGVALT